MAEVSRCCCHGMPLKYHVQYSCSRQHHCFRYLNSDTLGGTLLCRPLLHDRWSWIHRIRCWCSDKWDAINIFSPNISVRVLLCMYYHHTHCRASLMPSSSATLTTIHFFLVTIVPPLWRISYHIRRVFAHRFPSCLYPPRASVSLFPVIYSLTIARTFCFDGAGTPSPVSAIIFLFLFVPTLFWFSPWWPPGGVASIVIACLFFRGGIPYLARCNFRGTLRVLSSSPPSNIISPLFNYLWLLLPPFAVPSFPASLSRLHPPPPSPLSRNIFFPPSPSSLLSSSTNLLLSVLCHHFHTRQTPRGFSSAPLAVLLYDPSACHHHISVTPASLPPFDSRQLRNTLSLHPYPPLPLNLTYLYFCISIYIYISQSLSLSSLYFSISVSLYFYSTS